MWKWVIAPVVAVLLLFIFLVTLLIRGAFGSEESPE